MSNLSPLRELARFVGRTNSASGPLSEAGLALKIDTDGRPMRPRVTDMLAIVMALSARTRRMARDPVVIDLDVFSPDGTRAIKIACDA
jgi:uncharacterized protein (UPF0276 family)